MAVPVETDPVLWLEVAQGLFSGQPLGLRLVSASGRPDFPNYNVDSEGQRFVAVQGIGSESGSESRVVVVQNWVKEFQSGD